MLRILRFEFVFGCVQFVLIRHGELNNGLYVRSSECRMKLGKASERDSDGLTDGKSDRRRMND